MKKAFLETLKPFWLELAIRYYELALSQIHPLHRDVPYIVERINTLQAERRETFPASLA